MQLRPVATELLDSIPLAPGRNEVGRDDLKHLNDDTILVNIHRRHIAMFNQVGLHQSLINYCF